MAQTDRGLHPDLFPDGTPKDDIDVPVAWRDLGRRMADPSEHANYMQRLTRFQQSLPEEVQQAVQGRMYRNPQEYEWAVRRELDAYGARRGNHITLTDADVAGMSMADYDAYFDEKGRPKPGVGLHLQRGVRLDDRAPR